MMTSSEVALQVAQQAISILAQWADINLPSGCQPLEKLHPAVRRAKSKEILSWPDGELPDSLRLLFDTVKLPDGKGQDQPHYSPAVAIDDDDDEYPTIPYPKEEPPSSEKLERLKQQVKQALETLEPKDWQNLSLLTLLLEKFGSCLSFGEADIALVDMARATGAVAAALASYPETTELTENTELSLVAGDLSGIQKFIYTISSDGALKSLRARSFYLELVTEEIVQQLLAALDLPRTNVIYAGGGKLYLLAAATDITKKAVNQVRQQFNQWLLNKFQGKVFLALDSLTFPVKHVSNKEFAVHWSDISENLAKQKSRKFADQISHFLEIRDSHEPCRVCHRDDVKPEKLKPLNEDGSVLACGTCHRMFRLGGQLLRVEAIVRSQRDNLPHAFDKLPIKLAEQTVYYHLFKYKEQLKDIQNSEIVFLINNWRIDDYRSENIVPLLLGQYAQKSKEEPNSTMRAGEMAKAARGINRVGYLQMDVDKLGQIFARGLSEKQTLPRVAGLSRLITYFFKGYLNSLAANRKANLPDNPKYLTYDSTQELDLRSNLVFIYAGGDDLFVSGAWNEVVEFAFDVYQCFRAFTGHNPDITLSSGISIADIKFPLYQAAEAAKNAEKAAKANGRDSLGLFYEVFKWDTWLGRKKDSDLIVGILPLVSCLKMQQIEANTAKSFVRDLLITAEMQERMIEEREQRILEIKKKQREQTQDEQIVARLKQEKGRLEQEKQDIRYYLHLPKIAYTIARLPKQVRDRDDFKPIRISLKTPDNAPYFRAIATWLELLNRS